MGFRERGKDGVVNGGLPCGDAAPSETVTPTRSPLTTSSGSSRRTLTFPSTKATGESDSPQSDEDVKKHTDSFRPPALELLLQSELDAPEDESSPGASRWAPANRPPSSERAARSSGRPRSDEDLSAKTASARDVWEAPSFEKEASAEEVSAKDASAQEVSTKDVSITDVSAEEVSAKDVSMEDVSAKDASAEEVSANVPATTKASEKDIDPEAASPAEVSAKSLSEADSAETSVEAEALSPEVVPEKDASEKVASENAVEADAASPEVVSANAVATSDVSTNEAATNEAATNEAATNEAATNEAVSADVLSASDLEGALSERAPTDVGSNAIKHPDRPSDRPTVPRGLSNLVADESSANLLERVASESASDGAAELDRRRASRPSVPPKESLVARALEPRGREPAPKSLSMPVRPLPWAFEPKPAPRTEPSRDEERSDRDALGRANEEAVDAARAEEPPKSSNPLHVSPAQAVGPSPFSVDAARASTQAAPPSRTRLRRTLVPLLASNLALAAVVALIVGVGRSPVAAAEPRQPRVAVPEWSPLAGVVGVPTQAPPSGGCSASGASRMLAQRAQIGPGLDVSVLETGFAVGLASAQMEAVGLRVEGSGLRVAETVRVKTPSAVSHVTVEQGHDDENDGLDLRIDSDEARTVVGGDGPPFRIVARGGAIVALLDDVRGGRVRPLWPLPGAAKPVASALAAVTAKSNPYVPPGLSRPAPPARPFGPALAPETVRVAGRDDGGAVIALRRLSTMWLGVADASLTPAGPLVSVVRKGAMIGTPAVAAWGAGGVVAWAEKPVGDREWNVVVASFAPDDEGETVVGPVRVIARGMSPTIAALPDGDLLLAYADGPSGAHRVLARRLSSELETRGEAITVSPESVNAGQPVAAVRADGRALVAFFAADRGRLPSVHATALACDPGL